MRAYRAGRRRRREDDLLTAYSAKFGDALRRRESGLALRAAKVDAELAYRARGKFLASMNHELRTPLNAITGFAGILQQAQEMNISPEQQQEYLSYILESADLLLSHINTILEIADAESGGNKLCRRAVDLHDLIRQSVEQIEEELEGKVRILLDPGPALPLTDIDPDKIALAIRHLAEFLVDEEPLSIKLSTRRGLAGRSANFVYVALEADETEVDEALIEQALRVFDQVHEGLYRRIDQRRLGLPIAKSYIELNHGKFSIKTKPDEGVLIRFSLPVAANEHQKTAEMLAS